MPDLVQFHSNNINTSHFFLFSVYLLDNINKLFTCFYIRRRLHLHILVFKLARFVKQLIKKPIFVVLIIKETFYFYQVGSIKIFLFWQSL